MFTKTTPKAFKEANRVRRAEIKQCQARIKELRRELNSGMTRPWAILTIENGNWKYDSWRTYSSARGAIRSALRGLRTELCVVNMVTLEFYDEHYLKQCEILKLETNIWAVRNAKGDDHAPQELSCTQTEEA